MKSKKPLSVEAIAKEFFKTTMQQLCALEDRTLIVPDAVKAEITQDIAQKIAELMTDYAQEILDMEIA